MANHSLNDIIRRGGMADLLGHEDELRLGRAVQAGRQAQDRLDASTSTDTAADGWLAAEGMRARNELVVRNVRLAQSVARRYRLRSGGDTEDLFMYGVQGLFRAAELFDPDKGFKFSTYATLWVRQAINGALSDVGPAMHVPYPQQLNEVRLRTLVEEEGHTIDEAAAVLGMTRQTAHQLLAACVVPASLDQPLVAGDDGHTLGDRIESERPAGYVGVDDSVASDDQVGALAPVLSLLDRHERTIMELFLSAEGDAPTLDEVAASTGLPATLVRSKRISARSKLAHPAANVRQQLSRVG
jgi:RNA polymerase sigma factor (sigma-70 family)